jgi:hypothetical protein
VCWGRLGVRACGRLRKPDTVPVPRLRARSDMPQIPCSSVGTCCARYSDFERGVCVWAWAFVGAAVWQTKQIQKLVRDLALAQRKATTATAENDARTCRLLCARMLFSGGRGWVGVGVGGGGRVCSPVRHLLPRRNAQRRRCAASCGLRQVCRGGGGGLPLRSMPGVCCPLSACWVRGCGSVSMRLSMS